MPVQPCQQNGRPGFRWGQAGTCYTYTATSERSKERARQKAELQGRAIEANKERR